MREIKFSIIIPVFNAQAHIERCVNSVLDQITDEFEIILINDGSTDASGDLCNLMVSNYPDHIHAIHSSNEGAYRARLKGVKAATGTHICFLDADDYWEPNAIDLIRSFPQDKDLIMFGYHEINNSEQGKVEKFPPFAPGSYSSDSISELRQFLLKDDRINSLWSKIIKRELFQLEVMDDERYLHLSYAEDFLMLMSICERAESFYVSHEIIYDYVENSFSTTQVSLSTKSLNSLIFVFEHYIEVAHQWHMPLEMMRKRISEQVVHGLYPLMYEQTLSEQEKYVRKELIAVITSPRFIRLCRYADLSHLPLPYRVPVVMLRNEVIAIFHLSILLFRQLKRMLSFLKR